ncbi:uncharacterized protein LOC127812598 isoform X2 [Diospyros lotus]|uniref:uncharacterized protein LOC127812598 isoform X2 n=1 Tax=Diospyros lotus TaxID=55363 RepID=UPI00225B8962|nr:uncharacterized protein LOC127812598 isoform X2 [Diospyros lotus]
MAAKPLSSEAIAMTEKKMDMTLDDIIKMSKNNTSKAKKQRVSNRSQKFNNAAQEKSNKVLRFMETRSSLRQGTLARRRSNFQGNQFPLAAEAARKAAVAPIRNRAFNRGRGYNVNKPRFVGRPVQRNVSNGSFTIKHPQPQVNMTPKQRPQTLDSLFANMKEQRMRVFSQQNNAGRRIGGGQRRQQWGRGRYGN